MMLVSSTIKVRYTLFVVKKKNYLQNMCIFYLVFVIMIVMALITTFMTTPIVLWLYPEWYQKQTSENLYVDEVDSIDKKDPSVMAVSKLESENYYSIVTMMNRIDTVPSMMALIRLLNTDSLTPIKFSKSLLDIHVLRLLELTQRASDIMKIQDIRETQKQDPVLNVLRTFTSLIGIESLQTRLDFRAPSEFISTVSDYSESVSADLILLPWTNPIKKLQHQQQEVNPLEQQITGGDSWSDYQISDAEFAQAAYAITHCTVGLFIDRGFGHIQDGNPKQQTNFQIIVPFTHADADDCAALVFALRLQIYRQAEVLVLKPAQGNNPKTSYATLESIKHVLNTTSYQNSGEELLNTLFTATQSSNVSLRTVVHNNTSEYSTVLDGLEKPLDKHDLVVLGRSISSSNHLSTLPAYTPTPAEGSSVSPYSRGFKAALGNTAYQILSAGTLASLVVIQAPIVDPFFQSKEAEV